jgi:hypothetical protein
MSSNKPYDFLNGNDEEFNHAMKNLDFVYDDLMDSKKSDYKGENDDYLQNLNDL